MNYIKKAAILAIAILSFGCNNKESPDGECSTPISATPNRHNFSSEGGTIEITTKVDYWWFELSHNYYPDDETTELVVIREDQGDDISPILEVRSEWFSVRKSGDRKLTVQFEPNDTSFERGYTINLQYVNCFESIYISQDGR